MGLSAVGLGLLVAIIVLVTAGSGSPRRASGPFAWLRPASPPAGWHVARIPGGAALAHPPGWSSIKTDPGTASFALLGSSGRIAGYLNVTPKQGAETLANWSRFRPQKNREEGARNVRLLATTSDAHFRTGRGSCVIDAYTTSLTTYKEIACLVSGPASSAVVVAAAPIRLWQARSAMLEQAVSSFAV
jgi:hypothetical protein